MSALSPRSPLDDDDGPIHVVPRSRPPRSQSLTAASTPSGSALVSGPDSASSMRPRSKSGTTSMSSSRIIPRPTAGSPPPPPRSRRRRTGSGGSASSSASSTSASSSSASSSDAGSSSRRYVQTPATSTHPAVSQSKKSRSGSGSGSSSSSSAVGGTDSSRPRQRRRSAASGGEEGLSSAGGRSALSEMSELDRRNRPGRSGSASGGGGGGGANTAGSAGGPSSSTRAALGMASMSSAATGGGSTAAAGGGGPSGPSSTPKTGASKMAAAAKRGQAGVDGLPSSCARPEDDDHPLSERSLKARDYQTIHTLSRLFHLPSRWKLLRPLGQGAYGLVISVQDTLSGETLAVKCITRVFDRVMLARRALREITLLRHFGGHENLTGLIDLDYVWEGYNEIYLYIEPMEADLHQIVRSGQALSNAHIQYFLYQLLRGMKYVHSANVIHRDLKPGNLLVNADCELKICDFGLARGYRPVATPGEEMRLTEYVATRWYRAPEIMLSNTQYTTAIDVWAIGCILAELLGGKPLFKGKDYVDQLNLILDILGTPPDEVISRVGSDKAAVYMRSLPHSEPVPLRLVLPDADPQAVDLLNHLLTFDPVVRYTVPQALEHPYMSTYHDPLDEPECPAVFDKWEAVEALTTVEQIREAITREINEYRDEVRAMTMDESEDEEEDGDEGMDQAGTDRDEEEGEEELMDMDMDIAEEEEQAQHAAVHGVDSADVMQVEQGLDLGGGGGGQDDAEGAEDADRTITQDQSGESAGNRSRQGSASPGQIIPVRRSTGNLSTSSSTVAISPIAGSPRRPSTSPRHSLHDATGLGISPRSTTRALPRRHRSGTGGSISGYSAVSATSVPSTAVSEDGSTGHGAVVPPPQQQQQGPRGRTSRRSSGHSIHGGRRPASFLFSSPLGGGMTPLPAVDAALPHHGPAGSGHVRRASGGGSALAYGSLPGMGMTSIRASHHGGAGGVGADGRLERDRERDSVSTASSASSYWARPRSRAPSSTGEFASLRPLIRQLSFVGLDEHGRDEASLTDLEASHRTGGGDERDLAQQHHAHTQQQHEMAAGPVEPAEPLEPLEVVKRAEDALLRRALREEAAGGAGGITGVPMTVSPSDEPASEVPKSFGISRAPSVAPTPPSENSSSAGGRRDTPEPDHAHPPPQ